MVITSDVACGIIRAKIIIKGNQEKIEVAEDIAKSTAANRVISSPAYFSLTLISNKYKMTLKMKRHHKAKSSSVKYTIPVHNTHRISFSTP